MQCTTPLKGGLIVTLNEMAEALNVGFRINFDKISITDEIRKFQDNFELSNEEVLAISSTGTILKAIRPEIRSIVKQLMHNTCVNTSFIGSLTKRKECILIIDGEEIPFPQKANNQYTISLSRKSEKNEFFNIHSAIQNISIKIWDLLILKRR